MNTIQSLHTLSKTLTSPQRSTPDEQRRQQLEREARQRYNVLLNPDAPDYNCPQCKDTDLFIDENGDAAHCPYCHSRRTLKSIQNLSRMTASERRLALSDIVLDHPSLRSAVNAARFFIGNPSGLLTLYGTSGTAKTMILQAVVNECLTRNILAVYITFYDLAGYIREAYSHQDESALLRVNKFAGVKVLCIDELDKVKQTEWINELQTAIIDRRYRDAIAGLTGTLIAMNGRIELLPDWISSRLNDGRCHRFELSGADMRPLIKQ